MTGTLSGAVAPGATARRREMARSQRTTAMIIMKTYRTTFTAACTAALALLGASMSSLHAQSPAWTAGTPAPMNLQVASADTDSFALSQHVGKPLRGSNQEQLGTISDFLIDPKSGQVRFVVVPSGAGEGGETFRLVPMAALQSTMGTDGLTARIDKSKWDQVGTMTQQELPSRVTLNTDQLQRLSQQFGLTGSAQETTTGELVRASSLKGQALRSGNDQVGTIEEVAIDVPRRMAAAVVKSSSAFTGSEQKFLVPFQQLQWSGEPSAGVTTTLTRNQFQQAQSALSPTGFTGAPFSRGGPPPQAVQAAQTAVQQAVNQAAGSAGVQVAAETKLVLQGTVDSEQKRSEVERAAQQAAAGIPIDNKVTVKNQ